MASVADIHRYLPELCLEHCVASVTLHVICRLSVRQTQQLVTHGRSGSDHQPQTHTDLIKVPDPGNMVLPALSQHLSRVGDHHGRVPQSAVQLFSLQNWRHDYHVVFFGQLMTRVAVSAKAHRRDCVRPLWTHLLAEARGVSFFRRFCKLRPRLFLAGAESEGHGCGQQSTRWSI